MTLSRAEKISRSLRAHWRARRLDPAEVARLHGEGFTDVEIARAVCRDPSRVRQVRAALALPPNVLSVARAQKSSGRAGAAVRTANKLARASALRLPPALYTPLGIRLLTALASGPRTRSALATDLVCPDGHNSYLEKTLRALRSSGVVSSRSVYSPRRGPSVWALSPSTVSYSFSRTALAPLQQIVASSPAILAHADAVAARVIPTRADDARSAAYGAVAEAVLRFDPTVARFKTFAKKRIAGAVCDALRETGLNGSRSSLALTGFLPTLRPGACDSDGVELISLLSVPPDSSAEDKESFRALCSGLSTPDKRLLRLYYVENWSAADVARAEGTSPVTVHSRINCVVAKLRARLTGVSHVG